MKMHNLTQSLCVAAVLWDSPASARATTIQYDFGPIGVNFLTGGNVNATVAGF
jgi:hypothetical protein